MNKKDVPNPAVGAPGATGEKSTLEHVVSPSLPSDQSPSFLADDDLKHLMRQAFKEEQEASVDVLGGVQRRLRERSGGKFYKDGWSTSRHPPFATYFITALLMLATVVLLYAMIVPVIPDPVGGASAPTLRAPNLPVPSDR